MIFLRSVWRQRGSETCFSALLAIQLKRSNAKFLLSHLSYLATFGCTETSSHNLLLSIRRIDSDSLYLLIVRRNLHIYLSVFVGCQPSERFSLLVGIPAVCDPFNRTIDLKEPILSSSDRRDLPFTIQDHSSRRKCFVIPPFLLSLVIVVVGTSDPTSYPSSAHTHIISSLLFDIFGQFLAHRPRHLPTQSCLPTDCCSPHHHHHERVREAPRRGPRQPVGGAIRTSAAVVPWRHVPPSSGWSPHEQWSPSHGVLLAGDQPPPQDEALGAFQRRPARHSAPHALPAASSAPGSQLGLVAVHVASALCPSSSRLPSSSPPSSPAVPSPLWSWWSWTSSRYLHASLQPASHPAS